VVTDHYLKEARRLSEEALENKDDEALQARAQAQWEFARCTSWALVYYLAKDRTGSERLGKLIRYGKALDDLPRDLDLEEAVLRTCFAQAFGVAAGRGQIDQGRLDREAGDWLSAMASVNLDLPELQTQLLREREDHDNRPRKDGSPTGPPTQSNPGGPSPGIGRPQGGGPGLGGPGLK